MKIIITENQLNFLISESGIRNINDLLNRYKKVKIYFHQDLDGVATAIAMKKYLEDNGIDVVDSEVIQYGDKEFAIKKLDAEGDVMPVLVDFAHGKPMFVIHTDHHDTQAGVEQGSINKLKDSIFKIRMSVDNMSGQMLQSGRLSKETTDIIQDRLGTYLTQEYRQFNKLNPLEKWKYQ